MPISSCFRMQNLFCLTSWVPGGCVKTCEICSAHKSTLAAFLQMLELKGKSDRAEEALPPAFFPQPWSARSLSLESGRWLSLSPLWLDSHQREGKGRSVHPVCCLGPSGEKESCECPLPASPLGGGPSTRLCFQDKQEPQAGWWALGGANDMSGNGIAPPGVAQRVGCPVWVWVAQKQALGFKT